MPDITMCSGKGCTIKDTCYRFTATPYPEWQSRFETPPFRKDGTCGSYWKTKGKSKGTE